MPFNNIQPNAIDLFCGAGGLSKGLSNSGINVCLGVEINPIAAATYRNNLGDHIIVDDIHNVTTAHALQQLNLNPGELFLLAGCPPCQTFSSLHKEVQEGDIRDELVFEYVRFALEMEPLFILMENVPGMSRGRGKEIFKRAKERLEEKYVVKYDILNCADYGVAQTRKRLVLHGIRRDVFQVLNTNNDFHVGLPSASHANDVTRHPDLQPWNTAAIIMDLPPVEAGIPCDNLLPPYNHETNGLSDTNIQRIQYIQAHGGSRNCLPEDLRLPCHQREDVGYSGVYGIIDINKPAPTITGGCICYSKGRFGHPTQNRAITVREAARLQSFGDDFIFLGSRGDTALQVGNAVPPLLAEASGRYFLSLLAQLQDMEQ
jgi:DNA (cytosine-5)-methyltransferase 1